MEKNRLFIIISAAVAILGTFLPWYTTVFDCNRHFYWLYRSCLLE